MLLACFCLNPIARRRCLRVGELKTRRQDACAPLRLASETVFFCVDLWFFFFLSTS